MARFTLQVVSKMIVLREHGPFAHIEIPAADRPTSFAIELHDQLNPDCREHGGKGASCSQCCGPLHGRQLVRAMFCSEGCATTFFEDQKIPSGRNQQGD